MSSQVAAANGTVQQAAPLKNEQQDSRVSDVAQNALPPAPTGFKWAWNKVVGCVSNAWDGITFLFFRVLGCVSPSFAKKADDIYVRLHNVWLRMKNYWMNKSWEEKCQSLEGKVRELTLENGKMKQQRDQAVTANRQLEGERKSLIRENEQLSVDKKGLGEDLKEIRERYGSHEIELKRMTEVLESCRAQLKFAEEQWKCFSNKSEELGIRCDTLRGEKEDLQGVLSQKEQIISEFKKGEEFEQFRAKWLQIQEALASSLDEIVKTENQEKKNRKIDQLPSRLQEHEQLILDGLEKAIQSFPSKHPTRTRLETFQLIAKARKDFFEKEAQLIGARSEISELIDKL